MNSHTFQPNPDFGVPKLRQRVLARQYRPPSPLPADREPPRTEYVSGYFAFPPGKPIDEILNPPPPPPDPVEEQKRKDEEARQRALDDAYEAYLRDVEKRREARAAAERAEALKGEEDWVRSGMSLRNEKGERDVARTEAIRAELKIRDEEEMLTKRWEKYEVRWKEINAKVAKEVSTGKRWIQFVDIPWPVPTPVDAKKKERAVTLRDITLSAVQDFLLGGLKVRGCTVTRKDRIRSSLLRWHPDKLTGILDRVTEEDTNAVGEGISVVVRCLQQMNHAAK